MNSSSELSQGKTESNKIELKNLFNNLKNDYFLQKLFDYLLKKKSLEIIKYNKNIKKRINLNINDYKEYLEIYSSIEIEIIPVKNKYDKFININEENKSYYHIYFNNNEEEINRNYMNKDDNIKNINIIIDYQIKSFRELFDNCICIESIYFKKFYRNNITNMYYMFKGCSSLKEINLSNFNTNNVTNMSDMFFNFKKLKELKPYDFYTNNVTDMNNMFFDFSTLSSINLSNFITNNVKTKIAD